jgi:hypothetical protein
MVDRHVVKMILESCQLLSTAHRLIDGVQYIGLSKTGRKVQRWSINDHRDTVLYQATHINHPSAVWVRNSIENYNWLVNHLFALMDEYTHRYNKKHKCSGDISYALSTPPIKLKTYDWTEMPSCMAPEYIISKNPIENYRNYYKNGKKHLHKYTKRTPPDWLKD